MLTVGAGKEVGDGHFNLEWDNEMGCEILNNISSDSEATVKISKVGSM